MKKFFTLSLMALVAIVAMAQSYPNHIYLCGPAGPGWVTKQWPMYTNQDAAGQPNGTYEWVGNLNSGELKFLYGDHYEPAYVSQTNNEALTIGAHTLMDHPVLDDSTDNKFAVTAGRYKLVIDLTGENIALTVIDGTGLEDKNGDSQMPLYPEHLYLIGSGCGAGWSTENAIEMTTVQDGVYTLTTTIYGHSASEEYNELKFLSSKSWDKPHVGPTVDGESFTGVGVYSAAVFTEGDKKYHNTNTVTGVYDLTLNLIDSTLTVVAHIDNTPCTKLYMIGSAVGGWSFDDNAIELTSEDSVFTYTGAIADGELKFTQEKNFEAITWGADEKNKAVAATGSFTLEKQTVTDHKFVMTASENIALTINLKTQTMTVAYPSPTGIDNTHSAVKAAKVLRNGQIYILNNEEVFTATGVRVK